MNREDKLGEALNRCLTRRAESLEVTSSDTERMRRLVHRTIEEESRMKKWSAKRVMITAAAICVLSTVTVIAAGKVAYTSGSSSLNDKFAYSQLKEKAQTAGLEINMPETFSNGYTYDYGIPVHNEAMDEEHNVVKTAESLSLTYKKEGEPSIIIDIQGTSFYEEEEAADETFSYGGTVLGYSCDQYRFVPPDYEISQEEQALIDAGDLYLSYGSSEVEDNQVQSLVWKEGDRHWTMLTFDNAITAEGMVQMAGEILDNN